MHLAEDIPGGDSTCAERTTGAPVVLYAERFSDSLHASIDTFHDTKHSLNGVDQRKPLKNENQLYPDRIGKISNATGMMKCQFVP